MHVKAMEAQKAKHQGNRTATGTAFKMWDGLMLKLTYRQNDVVLCVWKKHDIPPTDDDVYIAKLNFFGNSQETAEARKGRFVWIKCERKWRAQAKPSIALCDSIAGEGVTYEG